MEGPLRSFDAEHSNNYEMKVPFVMGEPRSRGSCFDLFKLHVLWWSYPCQVIPHLVSHFVQPHQFWFCQLSDNFLGPVTSQSGQWHLISMTEICKLTIRGISVGDTEGHETSQLLQPIKSNQIKRQVAIPTQSHGHRNRCPTYQAPWNQNPCCTHVAPGPNEQVCPGALDRGQTNNIKGQPKQTTDMQSI